VPLISLVIVHMTIVVMEVHLLGGTQLLSAGNCLRINTRNTTDLRSMGDWEVLVCASVSSGGSVLQVTLVFLVLWEKNKCAQVREWTRRW